MCENFAEKMHKILMKVIKENLNKWINRLCKWMTRLTVIINI